jgi:hypothetical protein
LEFGCVRPISCDRRPTRTDELLKSARPRRQFGYYK